MTQTARPQKNAGRFAESDRADEVRLTSERLRGATKRVAAHGGAKSTAAERLQGIASKLAPTKTVSVRPATGDPKAAAPMVADAKATPAGAGAPRGATERTHVDGAIRLLQLEADIRRVASARELIYHLANESRAALGFRQGVVLVRKRGRMRVEAISSVSTPDRNAPMTRWLEAVARDLHESRGLDEVAAINLAAKAPLLGRDHEAYPFPHLLWAPIKNRKGHVVGGLIAAREQAWPDRRKVLAARVCETYSHAWSALTGDRVAIGRRLRPRIVAMCLAAAVVAAGFIPAPITAIAPVEVVGRDAAVVAAPIDGVIERLFVAPNDYVQSGALIARIEDTELSNAAEIADQAVVVASTRLEALSTNAFVNADARREVAIAKAELALAAAESDLAAERLARAEIRAPAAGLAVFADARDWAGRPVATGERLMEITDPARVEYRIELAVDDLIALREDVPVRLFFDHAPLDARRARITRASYHAEPGPGGAMAYALFAEEDAGADIPRIGARGAAQILGDDAPLAFVLLRRPIAWMRQTFGL